MDSTRVEGLFGRLLCADMARMEPGDIVVARCLRREEPEQFLEGPPRLIPVWLLVARGKGVISTSRFMYRIASAWAEDFATPDHMLRPEFLSELTADVGRSMDAEAKVHTLRIFSREKGGGSSESGGAAFAFMKDPTVKDAPVLLCDATDRNAARAALESGCNEYGRLVLIEAVR